MIEDLHFCFSSKAIAQIILLLKIIISLSMLSLSILDYESCVLCKVHKSFICELYLLILQDNTNKLNPAKVSFLSRELKLDPLVLKRSFDNI